MPAELDKKLHDQQAANAKLQRKYEVIKGDLKAKQAELLAAQDRQKALRHALTWVRGYTLAGETDHDKHIYEVVDKALAGTAGSPSEKPGSEEASA